jgi:hypothetical protein
VFSSVIELAWSVYRNPSFVEKFRWLPVRDTNTPSGTQHSMDSDPFGNGSGTQFRYRINLCEAGEQIE